MIGLASFLRNAPPRREVAEGAFALAVVATLCLLLVILPNVPWTLELAIASLCPLFVWMPPVFARPLRPSQRSCARSRLYDNDIAVGLLAMRVWRLRSVSCLLRRSFSPLRSARLFWPLCSASGEHELAILEESTAWKKRFGLAV
jgi:hypothetical protein